MRLKNKIWSSMYVNLIGSTTMIILEQMIIQEREEMEAIGLILSLSNPLGPTQKRRRRKNKKMETKGRVEKKKNLR